MRTESTRVHGIKSGREITIEDSLWTWSMGDPDVIQVNCNCWDLRVSPEHQWELSLTLCVELLLQNANGICRYREDDWSMHNVCCSNVSSVRQCVAWRRDINSDGKHYSVWTSPREYMTGDVFAAGRESRNGEQSNDCCSTKQELRDNTGTLNQAISTMMLHGMWN